MPLMSEVAFCTLPWPSAYLKSVTLGHLDASSLPEAVVTSRQLLPPKPSSSAKLIFLVPHQDGAPDTWVTGPSLPPPALAPLPQAETVRTATEAAARPGSTLRSFIGEFLPVRTTDLSRRGDQQRMCGGRRSGRGGCGAHARAPQQCSPVDRVEGDADRERDGLGDDFHPRGGPHCGDQMPEPLRGDPPPPA